MAGERHDGGAVGSIAANDWDGDRLFQAAKFGTEMQYQHLVFEEFARKIAAANRRLHHAITTNIDPAIFAEFAHTVYRFGHSMLPETIVRYDPDYSGFADIRRKRA